MRIKQDVSFFSLFLIITGIFLIAYHLSVSNRHDKGALRLAELL